MEQQPTATRRLVKSPPELWAELSSEDSLGRHLAEFGEIRITRVDPETTVAWEGDRASGTVELTPTGWGTKVMLTAMPAESPPAVADALEPPHPEPAVAHAPAPAEVPAAVAQAPPAPDPPSPPAPPAAPRGFFARLFRKHRPQSGVPGPPAPTPDPAPSCQGNAMRWR